MEKPQSNLCDVKNALSPDHNLTRWALLSPLWDDTTVDVHITGVLMIWEVQKVSVCGPHPDSISPPLLIIVPLEIWRKLVASLVKPLPPENRTHTLLKTLHTVLGGLWTSWDPWDPRLRTPDQVIFFFFNFKLQRDRASNDESKTMNYQWGNFRQQPRSTQRKKEYWDSFFLGSELPSV